MGENPPKIWHCNFELPLASAIGTTHRRRGSYLTWQRAFSRKGATIFRLVILGIVFYAAGLVIFFGTSKGSTSIDPTEKPWWVVAIILLFPAAFTYALFTEIAILFSERKGSIIVSARLFSFIPVGRWSRRLANGDRVALKVPVQRGRESSGNWLNVVVRSASGKELHLFRVNHASSEEELQQLIATLQGLIDRCNESNVRTKQA